MVFPFPCSNCKTIANLHYQNDHCPRCKPYFNEQQLIKYKTGHTTLDGKEESLYIDCTTSIISYPDSNCDGRAYVRIYPLDFVCPDFINLGYISFLNFQFWSMNDISINTIHLILQQPHFGFDERDDCYIGREINENPAMYTALKKDLVEKVSPLELDLKVFLIPDISRLILKYAIGYLYEFYKCLTRSTPSTCRGFY